MKTREPHINFSKFLPSKGTRAFTLLEVIFATAIGSIVTLAIMICLAEAMQLFRSCDSVINMRLQSTNALRMIANDIESGTIFPNDSTVVRIYSKDSVFAASGTTTQNYGSCVVICVPNLTGTGTITGTNFGLQCSGTVAFYIHSSGTASAGNSVANNTLYYCGTASLMQTKQNYWLSDTPLIRNNVVDMEVRDNLAPSGNTLQSYRIAIKVATTGWLYFSGSDSPAYVNQLIFSTSARPRNE